MRNCTRDEGRSFEAGSQVQASNRCKVPRRSHACNPHGAIIALQHPDIALVWLGSKLEITAPQHWHPLHPSEQTLCAQNGGCTATLILWRKLPQGLIAVTAGMKRAKEKGTRSGKAIGRPAIPGTIRSRW